MSGRRAEVPAAGRLDRLAPTLQWRRLPFVVNNVRFCLLPPGPRPNLASRVLALNCRRLSGDWERAYGHPVLLAETFVEV